MAATARSIRSMMRSQRFRKKNGLPPLHKKGAGKVKNWKLARKMLDNYILPESEEGDQKPDE
tara:strand:- start:2 stop:187 length:186 start_codon:yes stop_codon:yes gene_type:complete